MSKIDDEILRQKAYLEQHGLTYHAYIKNLLKDIQEDIANTEYVRYSHIYESHGEAAFYKTVDGDMKDLAQNLLYAFNANDQVEARHLLSSYIHGFGGDFNTSSLHLLVAKTMNERLEHYVLEFELKESIKKAFPEFFLGFYYHMTATILEDSSLQDSDAVRTPLSKCMDSITQYEEAYGKDHIWFLWNCKCEMLSGKIYRVMGTPEDIVHAIITYRNCIELLTKENEDHKDVELTILEMDCRTRLSEAMRQKNDVMLIAGAATDCRIMLDLCSFLPEELKFMKEAEGYLELSHCYMEEKQQLSGVECVATAEKALFSCMSFLPIRKNTSLVLLWNECILNYVEMRYQNESIEERAKDTTLLELILWCEEMAHTLDENMHYWKTGKFLADSYRLHALVLSFLNDQKHSEKDSKHYFDLACDRYYDLLAQHHSPECAYDYVNCLMQENVYSNAEKIEEIFKKYLLPTKNPKYLNRYDRFKSITDDGKKDSF
ncbi:MAG: hypothetical protein K6C69_04810 [Lachnospiraceae bacterium]|nr:hypothetical protein [Lachnospiraceae bacterium]